MPTADIDRIATRLRRDETPRPRSSALDWAGSAGTALDLALFVALTMPAALAPDRANAISYGSSIMLSFVLQKSWRFTDARGDAAEAITRFIIVSLASLLLSTMIVGALATAMPALLAKLLSLPVMLLWYQSMTRRFILRREG